MSYAAGLAVGATLGKGIHDLIWRETKPKPHLTLVSDLPGRRRYRTAGISGELAALLQDKLPCLPCIDSCRVNAASGSILLEFAPENAAKVTEVMSQVETRLFGGKVCTSANKTQPAVNATKISRPREARANLAPQAGKLTQNVRQCAVSISDWLKKVTGGWFDISSLASVFFLIRGIRKTLLTQQMPSGSQMLWWALSLMRGWRTA